MSESPFSRDAANGMRSRVGMRSRHRRTWTRATAAGMALLSIVLLTSFLSALVPRVGAESVPPIQDRSPDWSAGSHQMGYGVNPTNPGDPGIAGMAFDWTKAWGGVGRLPYRVLRREMVNASTLGDLSDWGAGLESEAASQRDYVEAWEIGNEPNLDAPYGWAAPPNAADYVEVLCEAYDRIKAVDPTAIVVSAGLAPTGRIPFSWNGHRGYCYPDSGDPTKG